MCCCTFDSLLMFNMKFDTMYILPYNIPFMLWSITPSTRSSWTVQLNVC
eukprot:UN06770